MIVVFNVQVVCLFELTNADRKAVGKPQFRFADLYHSANRTLMSTEEVPCRLVDCYDVMSMHELLLPVY